MHKRQMHGEKRKQGREGLTAQTARGRDGGEVTGVVK